ncbi:hypothetical protein HN858_04630 [Candidatus Falkowbacteria bacterium]|jgi:hypothetical protein|nr:hypothetical protein [Candidatus Falkowbacteria bacterium]MBT5503520.1 hypothetical protein [Candidatus Falkowbacteria bacterium]MBT6574413.1 hypothetical protein [Candidatus Falkowbacteria bacterium]MBT7348930.1 hypothetical protein [Candidatus Falkowbacteria bacterium]MBT7501286.1 hypothetical protein [Candidatus Falkowbacteria bacterium]
MKIQRTTDVAMDNYFLEALNPENITPLAELLEKTQANIKKATKSRLFREYLRKLMADSVDGCAPLILFRPEDTRFPEVELLINSAFELVGIPENLEGLEHPPVRQALEQTAYLVSLMEYIVTKFHHPSLAPGDVQGEHSLNGKFTIYSIDSNQHGNLEGLCRHLKESIELLQFEVEVIHLGCNSETKDMLPGISPTSNHIIIVDLNPASFIVLNDIFQLLTEERHGKVFVAAPMGIDWYRRFPFSTAILDRPNIHRFADQEYEERLPFLMNLLGFEE